MKRSLLALIILAVTMISCAQTTPSAEQIAMPVAATIAVWPTQTPFPTFTAYPTQTPFPTYTPYPTYTSAPTKAIVVTPTNAKSSTLCKPITSMDYTDNSKAALKLQNYVNDLPDVKAVSYVIPERLYSNTLSQLYFVQYVNKEDGKVYAKRYIVYQAEFGWKKGTFSLDGQCWIDPPR